MIRENIGTTSCRLHIHSNTPTSMRPTSAESEICASSTCAVVIRDTVFRTFSIWRNSRVCKSTGPTMTERIQFPCLGRAVQISGMVSCSKCCPTRPMPLRLVSRDFRDIYHLYMCVRLRNMLLSSIIFMDAFSSWSNPCPQILHVLCCICRYMYCTKKPNQISICNPTPHALCYSYNSSSHRESRSHIPPAKKKKPSSHSLTLSLMSILSHPIHHTAAAITSSTDPVNLLPATPRVDASPLGTFPVAASPKYHAPMSVSSPFCVNSAELGPTLDTEERNPPK